MEAEVEMTGHSAIWCVRSAHATTPILKSIPALIPHHLHWLDVTRSLNWYTHYIVVKIDEHFKKKEETAENHLYRLMLSLLEIVSILVLPVSNSCETAFKLHTPLNLVAGTHTQHKNT